MGVPLMVAGVLGGVAQGVGKLEEGAATSRAMGYKAQVAENNAKIAESNARSEIQAGETAAVNRGLRTRATVGQEKAVQGASGIDIGSGSAVDVRAGTAQTGMLDALTIRSNSAKQAYGQQVSAANDRTQAGLYKMQGEQAETAGALGAAGTLLSAASTVGGNWQKYQGKFAPSDGSVFGIDYGEAPDDI